MLGATEFKQFCWGPILWTGIHGEEVDKWEPGLICKYDSRPQGFLPMIIIFCNDNENCCCITERREGKM